MDTGCVFYVVGGDMRSCFLSLRLAGYGFTVFHFDPFSADALRNSPVTIISGSAGVGIDRLIDGECAAAGDGVHKALVLPVPVAGSGELISGATRLSIADICSVCPGFDMIFGGVIPESICASCTGGIQIFDYMKDDGIARKNSVATAEGAICDAEELSDVNIDDSVCLVTGFGRCAQTLANRLDAWGARVVVAARNSKQRRAAFESGYYAMPFCDIPLHGDIMAEVDYCFNTVPAPVVTERVMSYFRHDVVVVDIASKPGGVDFDYCRAHNIRYKHSLGIPGRLSPKTSGRILADATVDRVSLYLKTYKNQE